MRASLAIFIVPACSVRSRPGGFAGACLLRSQAALTAPARAWGGPSVARALAGKEVTMLRIYPVVLETLSALRGHLSQSERADAAAAWSLARPGGRQGVTLRGPGKQLS